MSNWLSNCCPSRVGSLLAISLVAAWCTQCDLKHGDDGLPDTGVDGLDRPAILHLLAPPNVRRTGAVIPITVEVTFPPGTSEASRYCVRLAGSPGKLVFPFGDRCLADSSTSSGDDPAAGGGGAAGENAGGASGASMNEAGPDLHVTQSCVAPTATFRDEHEKQHITGILHAAYFADDTASASLFGALYDNARCTGEPISSTAVLLDLSDPTQDGMAAGGAGEGGSPAGTAGSGGAGGSGAAQSGGTGGASGSGNSGGGSGGTDQGGMGGNEPVAGAAGGGGT